MKTGKEEGGNSEPRKIDLSPGGETMVQPNLPVDDPMLDEATQAMIGRRLRDLYDAIVHEPVPESLLKLLDELERKEKHA